MALISYLRIYVGPHDSAASFEAVNEQDWPLRQADMPDPGFVGLRSDSPGKTVLDGGIGPGYKNMHILQPFLSLLFQPSAFHCGSHIGRPVA